MSFGFPPLTRGVKYLLIATAVLSVGTAGLLSWHEGPYGEFLAQNLAFRGTDVVHGKVWELATYTFLNVSPISLLLALLMLWMFASPLERRWRTSRFLTFYFATTVVAALCTAAVGLLARNIAVFPNAGIWTALEALSAAFAVSFPDDRINMFFFMPVQARYLIHISVGITLLFILMTGSVLPYVCPMFGLAVGVVFARGALAGPRHLWLRARVWWIERRMANRKLRVVPGGEQNLPPRSKSGSDGYLH